MDRERVDALLAEAGLPPSTAITKLGGGTFNTVLLAATPDGDVVVKIPPGPELGLLSYEHGIMETEAAYYRLAADHGIDSVPRVLHCGSSLVLSVCAGVPWPEVAGQLRDSDRYALREAVGAELAALHRITGSGYGYPARPLETTWRAAFVGMVQALLDDAGWYEAELPLPAERIAEAVAGVSPVLDEVPTPVLVHFDLWDGNILVDLADGGVPRLGGLIDAERAFWGDPLAELVSLRVFGDLEPDPGLLAGYRAGGGEMVLDGAARLRLTLYRIYLYLIMWVESVPRRFDDAHVARLRGTVLAPLRAMLAELERAR